MEALQKKGKTRAIGVSNFSQKEIQNILDQCEIVSSSLEPYESH